MKAKAVALGVLWLGVWGCQTLDSLPIVPVPEQSRRFFGACESRDGGGKLTLREKGADRFTSRYDWVTDSAGHLKLEISDFIGRTLADFEVRRESVITRAQMARKLSVNAEQFLEFDGHFLGLSVAELGCILGLRLPLKWLEHEFRKPVGDKADVYATRDAQRTIFLSLPRGDDNEPVCARISWRRYLVSEGTVKFCFRGRDGEKTGTLEFEQFEALWDDTL